MVADRVRQGQIPARYVELAAEVAGSRHWARDQLPAESWLRLALDFANNVVSALGDTHDLRAVRTAISAAEVLLGESARSIDIRGVVISRYRDGKIAQEWEILDSLTMLQQLGVA